MEEKKESISWQRLGITIGIVLLTAVSVGGTVWYVMDQNEKEVKIATDKSVASLQKQINEIRKYAVDATPTEEKKESTVDIKNIDLKSLTGENTSMGVFLDTVYSDVNNDGKTEAVLTFQQDGTGGYKDYFIYGLDSSKPVLLYTKTGFTHGKMNLLKNSIGIYIQYVDANDPVNLNKPNSDMVLSKQLSVTWDGSKFIESDMSLF